MGALIVTTPVRHPSDPTKIRVSFSEPAITGDLNTAGNFTVDNGVTVSAAVLVPFSGNLQVDLTLSSIVNSTLYMLTVANVRDVASSTPISSPRHQATYKFGTADIRLNGVVEMGGQLISGMRTLQGDRPLGYNVLGNVDLTSPSILNVLPTTGTNINPNTVISFDVTDDASFRRILVALVYPTGAWELVHNHDAFGPNYLGPANTRTVIAGGWHYTLLRDGGWAIGGNPRLTAYAIDRGGNEAP